MTSSGVSWKRWKQEETRESDERTILSGGKILDKSTRLFQWNVGEKNLVTHLGTLSELESISIDDGVDAREIWRWEDKFPFEK